jgi:hypothetical protein
MEKKVQKVQNIDNQIIKMLFDKVDKPKNYTFTKINNVYDNRYRINLYCEEEKDNLIKKRICASYFCSFSNNELFILADK